jgi:signal transduction histidine kinase
MSQLSLNDTAVKDLHITILIIGNRNDSNVVKTKLNNIRRTILIASTETEAADVLSNENVGIVIFVEGTANSMEGKLFSLLSERGCIVLNIGSQPDQNNYPNQFNLLNINSVFESMQFFEKFYYQNVELNRLQSKCSESTRQLDEFVYIVSHDLKAPLRGLASLAMFMQDELGENPKQEVLDILHMIKSRTIRMQNLIDGILHFSKITNSVEEKEKLNIKKIISDVIDLVNPNSNILIESPNDVPELYGSKIKFQEVLFHLVQNAVKFCSNKEKGIVRILIDDKPNFIEVSISDNGIGIKPEHHEKIFGIFQTLQPKDKVESNGIGLTIAKKIVEQQGGKISIQSDSDKGATFKFRWNK